ncbi:MAG: HDOD domain-containing protein [Acidobacteriota bacterium]|nr:HDOD domain-containing protein [Acidobacteriota bacterium]
MTGEQAHTAEWSLLLIYLPGKPPVPGGVLLLDSTTDKLYVRVRCDQFDEDTQEVLSLLAPDLEQTAADLGGSSALARFEEWSNTLRLGARQAIQIHDPVAAVERIFGERVVAQKPLNVPVIDRAAVSPSFTREDLLAAQQSIPLSPIAINILSALQNSRSSLVTIGDLIAKDPAIAAHLVRAANSALYSRGNEVRSVSQALGRLGTDVARLHVTALTMRRAFSSSPQLHKVWNHSIDAVQIARQLCRRIRSCREDELMLVALVHDFGQLALLGLGWEYSDRHTRLRQQGKYPVQIERELCGVSHAEIGADLLHNWRFPPDMVEAIRDHHEPSRSGSTMAWIIYLVESLSETDEDVIDRAEHARALAHLRITNGELLGIDRRIDPDLRLLSLAATA